MPFDFGLVTRTEIGGSDLFGDIQSVLKSPTILQNSLGTPEVLVGIENNHFGEMSGIRDTCPEFRDTCPESENSRFRVMKYPTLRIFDGKSK